ncbi:MAG: SDR family NAD(P)-dependent oxidoreductase [Xanthomonadales bacterium]|nr:SDR family NAD(P)-dependent oxidoreductase [Gammaproteobacteria bacterium]MBT8050466.1 SDR family NAD(P)-dependent oxidoreductase [Gammaproteobacteria bacterium]NNJ79673.1 SDR family NAD(P)-dependent oxidoreductase [Xanthomonadales bacterium]NNL04331.1 SDR family NAD(P)-dependent oxidoreductase [Xanthomonadales bacterium]
MMKYLTIATVLVVSVSALAGNAYAEAEPARRAVLVTGASSGIGLKITETLSSRGFHVYAGARKPADLERLDAMDDVSAVRLDVTVQEEIDAAMAFVQKQGRGLYGVVNNAGVSAFAPLTSGPESEMDFVFDVNVYGPYRVNKAFLPLLDASDGRTVTIGSIAGFTGTSGIYSMSKFAIEAYTDSLAREIRGNGVHVAVIEPGGFKSKIGANRAARALAAAEDGEIMLSEKEIARHRRALQRESDRKDPDEVARAVYASLTADKPKRRYMVTPNADQAHRTIEAAMRRVIQLNHDQPYEFDRAGLIEVLDRLLAETEGD